jgi:hypothetical protein
MVNAITRLKSHYNSSCGTSYTGRLDGSSGIMLITVSLGFIDGDVSISEGSEDFGDSIKAVTEATDTALPCIVSECYEARRLSTDLSAEVASVVILVATDVALLVTPRSPRSKTLSTVLALRGMKRVQNKAIRIPRSTTRCFRMKRTTRRKNARPAMMSSLSIRSAFSRAMTSCFEVMRMLSSVS